MLLNTTIWLEFLILAIDASGQESLITPKKQNYVSIKSY